MPVAKVLCCGWSSLSVHYTREAARERRDWASPCRPPRISKPAILRAAADTRVREREMSFLLFCPIKLLLSPVVRGGGADTCTGAGGEMRKTITYQILHLIHVHMTGLLHEGIFYVQDLLQPAIFDSSPWAYVMCNWAEILICGRDWPSQ